MLEISSQTLTPPELETLIQEIQQIPPAQWNNLLSLLQVFRQAVGDPPAPPKVNQAAIDLLRSWREEGDEQEQRETWEFLKIALDEDRLSDRPLFPS
jgi:hypothetical protein